MSVDVLSQIGRRIASLAPLLTAAAIFAATSLGCDGPRSEPAITISKETTYITEPLRPDGLPDYERWLLEKYRDGVTHENNAGVLIYQAIWPAGLEPADYQLICDELGLAAIPSEDGALRDFPNDELIAVVRSFLVDQGVEVEHDSLAEDAIVSPVGAAWTTNDVPPLAEWLTANQETIDLVVEATNRPRLYLPSPSLLDDTHVTLVAMLMPGIHESRDAARALAVRSMWHLGEGRLTDAWSDALALHRLACLSSQGYTLVEKIIAIGTHGMAQDATLAILSQEEVPLELARQIQTDLAKLDSRVSVAESLGTIERVSALGVAVDMALRGPGVLTDDSEDEQWPGAKSVDWNIVFRSINGWYDKLEAAVAIEDCADRQQAFAKVKSEMRASEENIKHPLTAVKTFFSRRARSEAVAAVVMALFTPVAESAMTAEYRNTTKSQFLDVAIALAIYRAEHGEYPNDLDILVPDLLPKLPVDIFYAKPLHYQRTADGYLLYSVGENGIDDGGSSELSETVAGQPRNKLPEDQWTAHLQQIPSGADDYAIRLPRPPFKLPVAPASP